MYKGGLGAGDQVADLVQEECHVRKSIRKSTQNSRRLNCLGFFTTRDTSSWLRPIVSLPFPGLRSLFERPFFSSAPGSGADPGARLLASDPRRETFIWLRQ